MATDRRFLLPEVREGFMVPTEVKQAWAAELEVLKEVDKVCAEYDIPYYAEWGTLLGAVRHGGFIPWDDDLDISMARPDYERFLKIAPSKLPEGFSVYNYRNHEGFRQFNARVTSAGRINFDPAYLEHFANFPYMSGLDIFVLDYVCKDESREKERIREAEFVLSFADCLFTGTLSNAEKDMHFKTVRDKYGITIPKGSSDWEVQRILLELTEKILSRFSRQEAAGMVQMVPVGMKCPGRYFAVGDYENVIRRPFEDTTVPVPVKYDELLRLHYGNYLVPVGDSGGHDYPYFEAQKAELVSLAGKDIFAYTVDRSELTKLKPDRSASFKTLCTESLDGMGELFEEIRRGKPNAAAELQQLAIDLGTLIENMLGEGTKSVSALERFCEVLYEYSESDALTTGERAENGQVSGNADPEVIGSVLNEITETVNREILSRKFVLFTCVHESDFEHYDNCYEDAVNDPDTVVFVMMLPWGLKRYDNTLFDIRTENIPECVKNKMASGSAESEDDPKRVRVLDAESIDLCLLGPETIYIQDPYDERNPVFGVNPAFYGKALREYTDELIYVVPYVTDDFGHDSVRAYKNLKYYGLVPGVVYSDKTIVPSPVIRERYIEKLTEFMGEDTKALWEQRIVARELKDTPSHEGPKRLLIWFDPATILAYGEKAFDKIKRVIGVLAGTDGTRSGGEGSDSERSGSPLEIVWYIPDEMGDVLSERDFAKYREVVGMFKGDNVAIETDPDRERICGETDAFYGDPGTISERMRYLKKSVMIANIDV